MAFTYDESKLDEDLNRIRFELGDTDSNRPLLSDSEVDFLIDTYSTLHTRVAAGARLIVAKFSGEADKVKIENFERDKAGYVEKYAKLARLHEAKGHAPPHNTAQNVTDKTSNEADTSIVQNAFKRGMHDYN